MLFRGKQQRLPPISDPRWRPKEQRKIGQRLRQGKKMRLI